MNHSSTLIETSLQVNHTLIKSFVKWFFHQIIHSCLHRCSRWESSCKSSKDFRLGSAWQLEVTGRWWDLKKNCLLKLSSLLCFQHSTVICWSLHLQKLFLAQCFIDLNFKEIKIKLWFKKLDFWFCISLLYDVKVQLLRMSKRPFETDLPK